MKQYFRFMAVMVAALCIGIVFPKTVQADEGGFYIEQLDSNARVKKDGTIHFTERMTVNFLEPRHGLYKEFDRKVSVNRQVNGQVKTFWYKVKISDIQVKGAPFKEEWTKNHLRLKIGSKDQMVQGPVDYQISYVLDPGDDRIEEYDEAFLLLYSPNWNVPTNKMTFSVEFDQPTKVENAKVYVGKMGEKDTTRAQVIYGKNKVTGEVHHRLLPGTAVSFFLRLPEGYFVGTRKSSIFPYLLGIVSLFLVSVAGMKEYFTSRQQTKVVSTVEFYPPQGMTSAEVGYVIDGMADQKDIISLIFWLGDQGYLTLSEQKKGHYVLHKKKELSSEEPAYLRLFFEGLFPGNQDTFVMDQGNKKIGKAIEEAKKALPARFFGKTALEQEKKSGRKVGLLLLMTIALWFTLFLAGGEVQLISKLASGILCALSFILAIVSYQMGNHKEFQSKIALAIVEILPIALLLGGGMWWKKYAMYPWMLFAGIGIWSLLFVLLEKVSTATKYKIELTGKLLGFKRFIQSAELDRINQMVEENPTYFFQILPYAYVFNLTDRWVKQFETIGGTYPGWWETSYQGDYLAGHMIYSMNAMNRSLERQVASYRDSIAPPVSTSTFTSSGGGFSGGGFGGGGGGSW